MSHDVVQAVGVEPDATLGGDASGSLVAAEYSRGKLASGFRSEVIPGDVAGVHGAERLPRG